MIILITYNARKFMEYDQCNFQSLAYEFRHSETWSTNMMHVYYTIFFFNANFAISKINLS